MEKYGIIGQKICHDDSLSQITVKIYVLFYALNLNFFISAANFVNFFANSGLHDQWFTVLKFLEIFQVL